MKIALLNIAYYPNVEGGAEISTQKLAEELAKTNDVYVICHGEKRIKEDINGVHVIRFPVRIDFKNKIERVITRSYKIQIKKDLRNILEEIHPDVLHTNNLHQFSVIVWSIAEKMNIPVVHTLRDYTLLQVHRKFESIIIKKCSNRVRCVTAPSQFTLDKFIRKGLFEKAKIKQRVPNAIDFSIGKLDSIIENKKRIDRTQKVKFAYLGRYSLEKGVDWLISVFAEKEIDAELHLYGKGQLKAENQEYIEKENNIIDHGFLSEEELMAELKNKDVIVAPSLWDEPFGRIILDGYKNACPSIVTNRGGMPEVVDEDTGIVLRQETNECLSDALNYFLNRDNIIKMFPNIKTRINDYSIHKQVESFTELYKKILNVNE